MEQKRLLIALTPSELGVKTRHTQIHNIYRVDGALHLLRANLSSEVRTGGHWLGIASHHPSPKGSVREFCGQVLREVERRGYVGVACGFSGQANLVLREVVAQLEECLPVGGLHVPECYGDATQNAQVMVSSAISGGTLFHRMETAMTRFGKERVVMEMDCIAEDLYLPSPTGSGEGLSLDQVNALRRRVSASVFFSKELCTRYFTYQNHESGLHFVLFDDGDTVSEKIKRMEKWGLGGGILHYGQVRDWKLH